MSRFVLITTVCRDEIDSAMFRRLLLSLPAQDVEIDLHVVVRGWDSEETLPLGQSWSGSLTLYAAPGDSSLATARNIVIRSQASTFTRDVCVAFPDDDCWYPPRLLARVADELAGHDVVTGSYSPSPPAIDVSRFAAEPRRVGWTDAYEWTASVTQFVRGDVASSVGEFDERFGVGARYPSAEDADYLVRIVAAGFDVFYEPSLVVGHESLPPRMSLHFVGGVALLAKHARTVSVARKLLARRIVAGARHLIRGELSGAAYARGLVAVVVVLVGR